MPKEYSSFFNGENRSKSDQVGFYSMSNCTPHEELGILQNNLALTTDSSTPNEDCISEILSNGDVFYFSTESGKVWKRTNAGVTSLVHTNTNGTNKGCKLWQGYLYYATTTKLGRITEALASSESPWSSQDDSYATFSNGGAYKPMVTIGSGLYIGDGYYLALVDATHTFIADALDIPTQFTISSLGQSSDDILVGTIIGANVAWCKIFGWNRISPAWTFEDVIPEIGVNCFIKADNIVLFQAGTKGQIYYWSGSQGVKFKKIKNVTTTINPYNSTEYEGRALFAVGTGVYSIHRESGDFPYAVVKEFTGAGTIKSIIATVDDIFVSGGDLISHLGNSYATSVVESPTADGQYNTVEVSYRDIASGGSIGISTSVDDGSYVEQTTIQDTINKKVYFNGGLGKTNELQAKITLTGFCKIKSIILK